MNVQVIMVMKDHSIVRDNQLYVTALFTSIVYTKSLYNCLLIVFESPVMKDLHICGGNECSI